MATDDRLRALVATLRTLVAEVWTAHRDPDNADYNACESGACAWCEETAAHLDELALLASPVEPRRFTCPSCGSTDIGVLHGATIPPTIMCDSCGFENEH